MTLMIGSPSIHKPTLEDCEEEDEPDAFREIGSKVIAVAESDVLAEKRQRDGGNGDAENAQWQLHEPERIVQPRDRAFLTGHIPQVGGKTGIHHDIHLHSRRGDYCGSHNLQDFEHSRIAEPEIEPGPVAGPQKRRNLHRELQETTDERAIGQTKEGALAESAVDEPADGETADDTADVEKRRRHRGPAEDVLRVQHAHHLGSDGHHQDERKHRGRKLCGEDRILAFKSICNETHEIRRKIDAEQRNDAHDHERERTDFVGEPPR